MVDLNLVVSLRTRTLDERQNTNTKSETEIQNPVPEYVYDSQDFAYGIPLSARCDCQAFQNVCTREWTQFLKITDLD